MGKAKDKLLSMLTHPMLNSYAKSRMRRKREELERRRRFKRKRRGI